MTKSSELLTINGLDIELIRSRRKSLSLEVGRQGIKARAPLRMSKKMIIEFIHSKQRWLEKQNNNRPAPIKEKELTTGAEILFENSNLKLNILENHRGNIFIEGNKIHLPVIKSNRPLESTIKTKLISWYKKNALKTLEQRIAYYAPLMDVKRSTKQLVKVREYKRRWGSCDHLGSLSFNWRIIMAPSEVLDYVVIHELAHCHEFNHSKRFWNIVAQQMPDWKKKQDWLHLNGGLLYQF